MLRKTASILLQSGRSINIHCSRRAENKLCVLLIGGFKSTFTDSKKATFIKNLCEATLAADFVTFDHAGHGPDPATPFHDCTLTTWREDVCELLAGNTFVNPGQKLILVCSSMGLFLALHAIEALPQSRIQGIVGIGGVFSFKRLVQEYMATATVQPNDSWSRPSSYDPSGFYKIHTSLVESIMHPKNQLVSPIPYSGKLILLHGTKDADIPYQDAISIAEAVISDKVQVRLIKDGDHRLSSDYHLALLGDALRDVV
ncbi:Alpha/Beta hydrolase protein [Obelidium mucronatum]|nr:Alpha/Beta hydrolase protein [Obelidium mucronatum]